MILLKTFRYISHYLLIYLLTYLLTYLYCNVTFYAVLVQSSYKSIRVK